MRYEKALDLYLRGFKSKYIKIRCGISTQSLLKQELAKGNRYTKHDILRYQQRYISDRYTCEDVIKAYKEMSSKFSSLEKAAHRREIITLGCCFGQYTPVFRNILGSDIYDALASSCWHEKQNKVMLDKYGVENAFKKEAFHKFVSKEAVMESRLKRKATIRELYGVDEPNQNEEIKARAIGNMRKTVQEKYGVDNAMKVPEIAKMSLENRQKSMVEKYGAPNSAQIPSIQRKIFTSRKENGTLNTSKPENLLYEMLCDRFGAEDVCRNHNLGKRYPYYADFYIISRDMIIELNGHPSHGNHWFDKNDFQDRHRLEILKEKLEMSSNGARSIYRRMIDTWTKQDVTKRKIARKNNLNYVVFWDGDSHVVSGDIVPILSDARAWFNAGCPDRKDYE